MNLIPYICTTCGVQYEPTVEPAKHCKICEDERQYVNPSGQSWLSLSEINQKHKNIIELVAPNLYAIYSTPSFAIGQRAHLVQTPEGNIIWDCITMLDDNTIDQINKLGGIKAIAISHPHFYSTIVEWSKKLNDAPIYINKQDEQWLCRTSDSVVLWDGDTLDLWNGIELIRCGGHFGGSSVMYWPQDKGALLVGDTIQVCPDLKTVSFMYSYPNMIPLNKKAILEIDHSVAAYNYEAMYGAFGRYLKQNAKEAMQYSVDRYLKIFD